MKTLVELERAYSQLVANYQILSDGYRGITLDAWDDYNIWLVLRLTYPEEPIERLATALDLLTMDNGRNSVEEEASKILEVVGLEDREEKMSDVVCNLAMNPTGCNRVNAIFDMLANEKIHQVTDEEYKEWNWLMNPIKHW